MGRKTSVRGRLGLLGAASGIAILCLAQAARAQSSSQPPADRASTSAATVETLIVTATRRETNVQNVPIAIDAFDSQRLVESRVQTAADLQFLSPGLKISGGNLERVTLRGVGPNSIDPVAESGVGTYLDGVFLGNGIDQAQPLYDLDRVEVLRGPQGTLYGRDATVGAINYITKDPTPQFHVGAELTGGNYGLIQSDGFITGPLAGDVLTGRLAFRTENRDGYTPNLNDGKRLDSADNWSLRGHLTYKPTDKLRIDLTADYLDDNDTFALIARRSDPALPTIYEFLGGLALGTPPMPAGRAIDQNLSDNGGFQTGGASLKIAWDAGWATLTSLTAYRDTRETAPVGDLDFTGAPLLITSNFIDFQQITEDLYLVSPDTGRLNWTLGGSFFGQRAKTGDLLTLNALLGGGFEDLHSPKLETHADAVYGEGTYHIRDNLSITAGLRFSYEWKSKSEADVCGSFICLGMAGFTPFTVSKSWTEWSPHAVVAWQPAHALTAYFSFGRGFKAGGFNALTPQTAPYNPEISTNYEVGLKSESFDQRLLLNVALFHMEYDNLQVEQRVALPTPHLEIENAAKARVNGVEAQFVIRPAEFFQIDGNAAYLDAKYVSFPTAVVDFQPAAGPTPTFDASGNRLSAAPQWSANVGAQASTRLGEVGRLTLRGEYSYQGDVFFTPSNSPLFRQPAYNWLNARLTFESRDKHWTVAIWGKNLSNQAVFGFLSAGGPAVAGLSSAIIGNLLAPRTFGATLGFQY
jgi:iron complex outermembrane receptor protein